MTQMTLYTGGGVSLSPVRAEGRTESDYVRLIADEGMMLVNGERSTLCVDVLRTDAADWQEVGYDEPDPDLDGAEALAILLGEGGDGA